VQTGFPRFQSRDVTVEDQFMEGVTKAVRPMRLCNPADKNGEGVDDPTAHLMCYQTNDAMPFGRDRHVVVQNQFGEQALVATRPESLCLPAEKDGVPSELTLDHFKCYRVRRRHGTPAFVPRTVTVADQFETKTVRVVKPLLVCNPVDKNGEGALDETCHLTCYRIDQEHFAPRGVTVVDQFAESSVNALTGQCRKVAMLCVPSLKRIVE
jgi:hypothetical protein